MSFLDTLKKAADAVSGGAAKVGLSPLTPVSVQGQELHVVVSVLSTGHEVAHQGVYVDVLGVETITAKLPTGADVSNAKETLRQSFKIAEPGKIAASALVHVAGSFQIPLGLPPTYEGLHARHVVTLVARVDQPGMDSSSGSVVLTLLKKP